MHFLSRRARETKAPRKFPAGSIARKYARGPHRRITPCIGLCYQLGGDNISVLSAVISLPADNN